jgi:hypothetical protein
MEEKQGKFEAWDHTKLFDFGEEKIVEDRS